MITVEYLNQDCLELIYNYLSTRDLFALSLSSRTFTNSATPRLYACLVFHVEHAKKYTKIVTPFTIVTQRPHYAAHVRTIDVRAVPLYKGAVHTTFLREYVKTLELAHHLVSFTCTQPILISPSLKALQTHPYLSSMRISAKLTQEQCRPLQRLRHLENITLDASTWNVVDVLPNWTSSMMDTLTALTFHSLTDLNDTVLTTTVSALPNLTKFHVVNCGKIQHDLVISLTAHLPKLQSLAFTCWDHSDCPPTVSAPPSRLSHLAIENHIQDAGSGRVKPSWTSFIELTREWQCALTSVVFRPSVRTSLHDSVIAALLDAHDATLRHLMVLNCGVSMKSVQAIAARCTSLERLGILVPHKDVYAVAEALSYASVLDTLHDVGSASHQHGVRSVLTKDSVRVLMDMVPSLRKVISWDRVWTGHKRSDSLQEGFELTFEKRRNPTPSHWFVPPV